MKTYRNSKKFCTHNFQKSRKLQKLFILKDERFIRLPRRAAWSRARVTAHQPKTVDLGSRSFSRASRRCSRSRLCRQKFYRKEDPENTKMENGKTRGSEEICLVQLANNDASRNQLTRSARPSQRRQSGPALRHDECLCRRKISEALELTVPINSFAPDRDRRKSTNI